MVFVRRDSVDNKNYCYFETFTIADAHKIFDGSWNTNNIPDSEILVTGVFLGCASYRTNALWRTNLSFTNEQYENLDLRFEYIFGNGENALTSDEYRMMGLRDHRGNVIFTAEYGVTYRVTGIKLLVSLESISLMFEMTDNRGYVKTVTMPTESIPVVIDSWAEYSFRQRAIDKEMRNIQMNKQLISEVGQAIGSAFNTSAFGAVGGVGGKGSAGMGAQSLVGGLISAGVNYGVNAYFSPKEQEQIDKSYKYANDMLSNYGDFSYQELLSAKFGIVKMLPDCRDNNVNDIATYGYPVNISVESFDNYIRTGKIQADVELLDIDSMWASQIQSRFSNGVDLV